MAAPRDHERSFPDPVLAANLYCKDHLDDLIGVVIKPFWDQFITRDPDHIYYIWLFRYSRCGEHLKLRIHGPARELALLRALLQKASDSYFSVSGEPPTDSAAPRRDVPPIDREDLALQDYPDRSLLWTNYERSIISLGPRPFLLDDTYVALFTRCLGMACQVILAGLDRQLPSHELHFSHRFRQATLLKLILSGLTLAGLTAKERLAYLTYHRDWLIRGMLAQKEPAWRNEAEIIRRFGAQAAKLDGMIGAIAELARSRWEDLVLEAEPVLASWQHAVADFARHLSLDKGDAGSLPDPFADNLMFPALFKMFHVIANQIGLKKQDEALSYHLLLLAHGGEGAVTQEIRRVPLIREFSTIERAMCE